KVRKSDRLLFFFSSRRRHTRFSRDWSSDVCSSDLTLVRFDSAHGMAPAGVVEPAPRIVFPPDGARVDLAAATDQASLLVLKLQRSEERRVGKEGRRGLWTYH